jgi:hypothetical protein
MCIYLTFLRDKNIENDDRITINPVWNDVSDEVSILEYKVTINYASVKSESNQPQKWTQTVSKATLSKYVNSLLTLFMHDSDPFNYVQLDAPNYPSVLLTVDTLRYSEVRYAIDDMLDVVTSSWPTKVDQRAR